MQELLLAVARGLVEDKEAVTVTADAPREDGTVVYHLSVAENDMGRVIGKQGRIAKAFAWSCGLPLCARARKQWSRSTEYPRGLLQFLQKAPFCWFLRAERPLLIQCGTSAENAAFSQNLKNSGRLWAGCAGHRGPEKRRKPCSNILRRAEL